MVWMLVNNCDAETGASIPLTLRAPFLEYVLNFHNMVNRIVYFDLYRRASFVDPEKASPQVLEMIKKFIPDVEYIENLPSPRIIKTHLPLYLLNPKLLDTCKVTATRERVTALSPPPPLTLDVGLL